MADAQVESLLDAVPGVALAVATDGTLVAGTDSSTIMFGRAVEELTGKRVETLAEEGFFDAAVPRKYEAVLAGESLDDPDLDVEAPGEATFLASVPRMTTGWGGGHDYEVQVTTPSVGDFDGTVWSLTERNDHQRYAETVEALHRATRRLFEADDREMVYRRAGEAANEVLGFPGVGVREYDPGSEVLGFVAFGGRVNDADDRPDRDVDGSPQGRAFRRGETVIDSIPEDGDRFDREVFNEAMYVPLGDYGVLSLGKLSGTFDEADRRLAEILAKNTEVALDQFEQRRQLWEQRRELRRQNERLEQFANVVSHDLRNPLQLAQGAFETYRETDDTEQAESVSYALDRMQRIIEDVLTMAREGESVEEPEPVDLESVAREAWHNAETEDLTLAVAGTRTVAADRDRLLRALENLFRNAAEYAGDGATVTVEPTTDGFAVADDGVGLDVEDPSSVFEAGRSSSEEGTGFGLAIVERIAHAHGWSVTAGESDGGGARFAFEGVATVEE